MTYLKAVRFACRLQEKDGTWIGEHSGPDVGPIRVTGRTREEALRKLEEEIRYWLEMCPCSGQTFHHIEIQVLEK